MEISPQTTVNALLHEFPQLEAVLIALNPQFKKLKNPILRQSIGRVATLQQAASVAGIPTLEFVNHLRHEVGQQAIAHLPN